MKIRQKILNLILIIAITCSTLVFTRVESIAADIVPTVQTTSTEKQTNQDVKKTATIPEKNAYAMEHMQKTGLKYAFFKFLLAMLGVLVSALAIFAGLKFYKKIVLKSDLKQSEIDYDKTLESPKNFKEAINLFLNKTNKR